MDDLNNNLENQINESFELFNDAPSDRVWGEISSKLDQDDDAPIVPISPDNPTNYGKFLLIGLFLLSAISLAFYLSNNTISDNNEISEHIASGALEDNKGLSSDNHTKYSQENTSEVYQNDSATKKEENSKSSDIALNESSDGNSLKEDKPVDSQSNVSKDKTNNVSKSGVTTKLESSKSFANTTTSLNSSNEDKHPSTDQIDNKIPPTKEQNRENQNPTNLTSSAIIKPSDRSEGNSSTEKIKVEKLNAGNIKNEAAIAQEAIEETLSDTRNLIEPLSALTSFPISLDYLNPEFDGHNMQKSGPTKVVRQKKIGFSLGLNERLFNTISSNSRTFNVGNSIGFRGELHFLKNLSFTTGLRYNNQKYSTKENMETISEDEISLYYSTIEISDQVTSLEVETNYFDIPLGLKYLIPLNRKKGLHFYLNPSIGWRISLPQAFTYNLIDQGEINKQDFRYYSQFGLINLDFGIEKRINDLFYWQIGLWHEQSLTRLGYEAQELRLTGMSTSILYNF